MSDAELVSSPVADDEDALAQQLNNVRRDVLLHDHSTVSDTVDHVNLDNKGTNTHSQIDAHIAASEEVHELPEDVHVLGAAGAGMIVVGGQVEAGDWVLVDSNYTKAEVDFPMSLVSDEDNKISVVATRTETVGLSNLWTRGFWISNITSTGFQANCRVAGGDLVDGDPPFCWMAIGKVVT